MAKQPGSIVASGDRVGSDAGALVCSTPERAMLELCDGVTDAALVLSGRLHQTYQITLPGALDEHLV